jgi:hypothetical protein
VEPTIYIRKKPGSDFIKASSEIVDSLLKLSTATAPIADKVSVGVKSTLDDSGKNYTGSFGVPLLFAPREGHPEDRVSQVWTASVEIAGKAETITITAELENVASVFAPTEHQLNDHMFGDGSADDVLSATFLGEVDSGGYATVQSTVERLNTGSNDLDTFRRAKKATDANAPCENVASRLASSGGFSPTDKAVVLWALARKQPEIGASRLKDENLDKISCISQHTARLNAVGITLKDDQEALKPPQKTPFNPGRDEIDFILSAHDKAFVRFFQIDDRGPKRAAYARSVFQDKATISDPGHVIFQMDGDLATLENADQWAYLLPQSSNVFLTRIGCYAYFPSGSLNPRVAATDGSDASVAWAIGLTRDKREVALKLTFAASDDTYPLIRRVDVMTSLSGADRDMIQNARKRSACGDNDDWKPALLFG